MTKKLRDLDDVLKDMTLDEARRIVRISNDYPLKKKALSICGSELSMRVKNLVPVHVDVLVNKAKKIVGEKQFRNFDDLLNNMTLADANEISNFFYRYKGIDFPNTELCRKLNIDESTTSYKEIKLLLKKADEVIKRHSLNPKVAEFENSMKEAKAVTSNLEKILEERGKTHGNFADVSYVSQTIKIQLRGAPRYDKTTLDMRESLDMIAGKMARIVCGNSKEIDHWRDIEGYAALVRKQLEVEQ